MFLITEFPYIGIPYNGICTVYPMAWRGSPWYWYHLFPTPTTPLSLLLSHQPTYLSTGWGAKNSDSVPLHVMARWGSPWYWYHSLSLPHPPPPPLSLSLQLTDLSICLQAEEQRTVTQYHYTSWPDEGVPDTGTALIGYMQRVKKDTEREDSKASIVVHCR